MRQKRGCLRRLPRRLFHSPAPAVAAAAAAAADVHGSPRHTTDIMPTHPTCFHPPIPGRLFDAGDRQILKGVQGPRVPEALRGLRKGGVGPQGAGQKGRSCACTHERLVLADECPRCCGRI
eukprot:360025-Chlamydomonas_euryale.AAC.3